MKKRLHEILKYANLTAGDCHNRRKNWFCRCVKQRDFFAIFIKRAGGAGSSHGKQW